MKTWSTPVVEEVKLSDTQYGGQNTERPDGDYQDQTTGIWGRGFFS